MKQSQFPLLIRYSASGTLALVYEPKAITNGASFRVLKTNAAEDDLERHQVWDSEARAAHMVCLGIY